MQGAKHQVPGLGGGHGQADGLQVAHLADQDDIRVLAEGGAQGLGEAQGVAVDLALVDEALLAEVNELDGVLDGEDVLITGVVEEVHHRRQGGGLARARGAGHQDQAAGDLDDLAEDLGGVDLLQGQDLGGDGAQHGGGATLLIEGVDAEAGQAGDLEGEVRLQELLVVLALLVVHDVIDQPLDRPMVHGGQVDAPHVAIDANHGRQARGQMQVRGLILDRKRQ